MWRAFRNDESGFTLIEVLVSAVLVATVSGSVYGVVRGASKTSGAERARATAAAFNQQELEKLRAQSPATIAAYVTTPPAPVTSGPVNGVTYTTTTAAAYVDETTGGAACSGSANVTRYVKVTTTTTWPGASSGTRSVVNRGLVPVPSGGGRLVAQVLDATKDPQGGVTVNLTGPSSTSAVTSTAGGCVEWDYLAPGTYNVQLSTASGDFVDKDGNTSPQQSATVVDGKLNTVTFDYDQGGRIQADFWYSFSTGSNPTRTWAFNKGPNEGNDQITVTNNLMPSGSKTFGTPGTAVPTITTGYLFPFPSSTPYTVIAGTCEIPKNSGTSPIYTAVVQPGTTVFPTAAGSVSDTHGIRLMEFTLTAKKDNVAPPTAGLSVTLVRQADAVCPADKDEPVKQVPAGTTSVVFPAVPGGKYDICTQWTNGTNTWHSSVKTNVDLTDYSAPGSFSETVGTGGAANGACP